MAPATSPASGLSQPRAPREHPDPPTPVQGTQQHLFPMGLVGATAVGWGAAGEHLPTVGRMQTAASGAGNELGKASWRLGGDELGYGVSLGWKGHR